jgi:hypothetical protein
MNEYCNRCGKSWFSHGSACVLDTVKTSAPKPPVADHEICLTCGSHIELGMMPLHYGSLHPEYERLTQQTVAYGEIR